MEKMNIYSPLDAAEIRFGKHNQLIRAINVALDLAGNDNHKLGEVLKVISIDDVYDACKNTMKYDLNAPIHWDLENVRKEMQTYMPMLRKLYELQGWKVQLNYNTLYSWGDNTSDRLEFIF